MSSERKVAVITGASQGIGASLVRAFLERGCRVVANSRSINPRRFRAKRCFAVAGDIANPAVAERVDRRRAVEEVSAGWIRWSTTPGVFVSKSFHGVHGGRLRQLVCR